MASMGSPGQTMQVVMFDTLSATNDYSNELIEALAALGVLDLTVLTLEGSRLPPNTRAEVLRLLPDFGSPEPLATKLKKLLGAYAAWWRSVARRPRGTVVHVQFFKFAWIEALLLLAMRVLFGAKLVYTAHNPLPHVGKRWHAPFYRWWYGRADLVHVLSHNVEQDILGKLGARPRRMVRIPHGPYTTLHRRYGSQWTRAQARERLGMPEMGFVVLQYGLFRQYKGLDVLLRAFVQLDPGLGESAGAGVRLLLAGGGYPQDLATYRQILQAAGRDGDVRWMDRYVSDEELCLCLTAADVAVFPYRHVSQSGALVLALTFGLPCIASDLPGFREALGLQDMPVAASALADTLFPEGNANALAQRLQSLMQDPARLEALRSGLAIQVKGELNWARIAARTAAAYRALLPV